MIATFRCHLALALLLAFVGRAPGATVAYWDFEDGVAGQEFTPLLMPALRHMR
ncbi:hypothetical protein Pla108_40430 [Botrimarina colliarenosi]|uniref:Uncharacterized protein n=1 Tax=Botrimarina colliarenosi TaxID=2528001 RepID=A0A5C6A3C9_9BACT|nr:hypothetical protein [Botrimarina colliarenosi]TWT92903.1 hypothetical protein Pla108_40430 [Botrimarina colliarenosi]